MLKGILVASALLAFSAVSAGVAQASTATYDFTVSGSGISGSGAIVVSTTAKPGVDDITSVTGTFSDSKFSGAITGLVAGSYSATSPTVVSATALDQDTFDNLFYPTSAASVCSGAGGGGLLDNCGFTFAVGTDRVNIFEDGTGNFGVFDWTPTAVIDFNTPVKATFTLATPESSTSGLTLIGLGMLGFAAIRKRKVQGLTQAA